MEVLFIDSELKEYMRSMSGNIPQKADRLISLLQMFGTHLRPPDSKKIQTNIYELRSRGKVKLRIFYCFYDDKAIILHAFIKKTQKTPQRELKRAIEAQKELAKI